jgi:hypothetical protein
MLCIALIIALASTPAYATDAELELAPPAPATGLDPLLGGQEPVELANCGPWTCTPSQDCIYCGNSYYCKPEGYTCCYPTFCTPTQDCVYCGNSQHCYAEGSTCCYPDICEPDEVCVFCGTSRHCYPQGSSCCYGDICTPEETCDWVSQRCV